MSFKDFQTVTANISNLFKLNHKSLKKLIGIAKSESSALGWLRKVLNFASIRETQKFVSSLIYSEDVSSSEDYTESEEDSSSSLDTSSQRSSQMGSQAQMIADDISVDDLKGTLIEHVDAETRIVQLQELVNSLNSRISPNEKQFTAENVKLIVGLASGHLENIDLLDDIMMSLYEELPISIISAKEIMAVSTGNLAEILGLFRKHPDLYAIDNDEAPENPQKNSNDSIFNVFNLKPSSPELGFLIRLAKGDHTCWEIHSETDALLGMRIHFNSHLLQSLTALISGNTYGTIETIDSLSEFLELDRDMLLAIIMISNNCIDHLPAGISPLAQRLEVDPLIAGAFIPSCYKTTEMLEQAFQSFCEKLSTPPVNASLVAAIFKGAKGDLSSWVNLGIFYMNLHKNPDKDNLDQVLLLRAFEAILTEKFMTEIKDNMFVKDIVEEPEVLLPPGKSRNKNEIVEEDPEVLTNNRAKDVLIRVIGFNKFARRSIVKRMLENDQKNNCGNIMLDLIIGIARNDLEMAPVVMRILAETADRFELVKALISLYNGNTDVFKSTELIEEYVDNNPTQIPSGALQTILCALKGFSNITPRGIDRASKNKNLLWSYRHIPGISKVLVSAVQCKLNDSWTKYSSIITELAKKITNRDDISYQDKHFEMLMLMFMGKIKPFMKIASREFGIEYQALQEMFILCIPKNPWNVKSFAWVTESIKKLVPKLPPEVIEAWVKLIGREVEDLDYGRKGMGTELYTLVKYLVESLPKNMRFKIKSNDELPEIKVFDSFFLACTDPYKYTKPIADAMPDLAKSMMPSITDDTIVLLTGIVSLFQSDNNKVIRARAISDLSDAFSIDYNIVQGLISIAKSDWEGVSDMAGRFCEFDPHKIAQLVLLVKRLKLVGEEEYNDKDQNQYLNLKEKLDAGGDIDNIFHVLDKDGSGLLEFEEFIQVMKYFDLEMTHQRLLQIFSKFDADGSASMNLQEFEAAFNYIKSEISRGAMDQLGLAKKKLVMIFVGSVLILILVFAFLFLGIIGFISVSKFGTAVNSILPMSSGGIISKMRDPGNLDSKINEISSKINNSMGIITVEENTA